ncbi:hypothetical protein AB0N77_09515 [Streptomyces misionensis]|uniref:hypothetical protein n=1 Tax=Streptomyces misionensis TaxID=67331 RepID=UPI0034134413
MNTKRVNAAADVIARAMESGYVTPTGWASALESAQLLQSPETAAEFEKLRLEAAGLRSQLALFNEWRAADGARMAELLAERHSTNEALDDAVQELRARRNEFVPYVSRPLPPRDAVCARPGCGHSGADHHHGDTKCWANLPRTRQRNGAWSAVPICDCSGFVASAEAPGERGARAEGEHYAVVHHDYRVSHDLPPLGGAS